jgi:hypothetical protein
MMGDKFKKVLDVTTIPRSRHESLDKACVAMHTALCYLDDGVLDTIVRRGGVEWLIQQFARAEEMRDITKEMKEIREKHAYSAYERANTHEIRISGKSVT